MAEESGKEKSGITIRIPRFNPWMVSTAILAIILAIFLIRGQGITGRFITPTLSAQEVADKAINYINKYLLRGQGTATLISVKEENGLYNLKLSIAGRQYDSYVTMDGKLLFPSGIDLTQIPEIQEEQQPEKVPKTDKPDVHAFVMSYCPFGLQFIKAYIPVMELLGKKANLELNFVHYIMHGEKEMVENTRMYCIQKEQRDKFTKYLRCFVASDDPEKCIKEAGIDRNKLETCMQKTDEKFQITKTFKESEERFPPYKVDAELAQKYDVRGSPTFVINGKKVQVARSADAVKEAVCSSFIDPPDECKQKLSTTVEQPGIGAIGVAGSTSSGGACG